jgi:hypothetical protein
MSVGRVGAYPARYGRLANTLAWPGLAREFRQPWQAIAWGLLITIGQVALACLLSGEARFQDAYLGLFQWDGHWYGHIAERGYQSPAHMYFVDHFFMKMSRHGDLPFGNVAFFPAYPLLGRFLHSALGLRTEHALLLTSQLGCWGLWSYLLLFFQRWGVSGPLAALGVLAILIHPASFYLVASYSEPVFLMGVVGFLFWSGKPGAGAWILAALHGCLMTATRLVGLPLAVWPFCQRLLGGRWLGDYKRQGRPPALTTISSKSDETQRALLPALVLGGVASLGSLLFFAYCQWRFGQWDLYMKTEEAGWKVHANYLAIFSHKSFSVHWPKFGLFDPTFVSRLCVPVVVLLFAGFMVVEWKLARSGADTSWRQRAGFYFCGWVMFYVCLAGHYSRGMSSMVRFSLCPQVLLVLAAVHFLSRVSIPPRLLSVRLIFWLVVGALLSLAHQLSFTYQFTHAKWIA